MAAADYFDQVQKLYIAYFGRPADPTGLNFWAANIDAAGGNFNAALAGFASSAESQALYAAGTTSQLVTSVYVALFNRPPEAAGLAYWVSQIDAGTISGAQAAFSILSSAGPGDAAAIANKLTAAKAFTANIDTSAELAGYSGANSAAIARAYLAKFDSTPYSVASLSNDATQAAAQATGVTTTAPTPAPAPVTFTATRDGADAVTFANAGTNLAVTKSGSTYTFTSDGAHAGTATITGNVSSISVPAGTTLTADLNSAYGGATFPGAGTVKLNGVTSINGLSLTEIEQSVSGLLDATSVTTLIAATPAQAVALLDTNNGTSGNKIQTSPNIAVSLSGVTATGSDLKTIDDKTTGVVTASGIASITDATVAQAKQVLVTNTSTFIHNSAVSVALTDSTASASDLIAIDAATTGTITAASLTSVDGTGANLKSVLDAATLGTAIFAPNLVNITFTNASTSNIFSNATFKNNTLIKFADVASNELVISALSVGPGSTVTLDASSLTGTNSVELNAFNVLNGSIIFKGGAGEDTFFAGRGSDTMTGGGGNNLFSFNSAGSLIGNGAGANIDKITDWNSGGAVDRIVVDSTTTVRAADNGPLVAGSGAGSNVQQSAGGKITFDALDNTLALKVAAVQADAQLNAAQTVAFFEDGANTYIWYSGNSTATTDDQLIELTGVTGLTTMTGGNTSNIV